MELRQAYKHPPCHHCGLPSLYLVSKKILEKECHFCCHGCLTVYEFIHEMKLSNYYDLKKSADSTENNPIDAETLKQKKSSYSYIDSDVFKKQYAFKEEKGTQSMLFFVKGVHCLACVWIFEKIKEMVPHVIDSSLFLNRSLAKITIEEGTAFQDVLLLINKFGYSAHPVKEDKEAAFYQKKENQKILLKLGVAGFCTAQIMMNSVALYVGAEGFWAILFNRLNCLFILPIVFYSAIPFYETSYQSIKQKSISLDIPIVLALLLGTMHGFFKVFTGTGDGYFDTLSTLIFLLLGSRYFLRRMQQSNMDHLSWTSFLKNDKITLLSKEGEKSVIHMDLLKKGDVVFVSPGEIIPVDGMIKEGSSQISNSLLTGESFPIKVKSGDKIFSGSTNISSPLIIEAHAVKEDSQLGKMILELQQGWGAKSSVVTFSDKMAKYLVKSILFLAFVLFIYFGFIQQNMSEGFSRILSIIIISCPCALGLAVPLSMILSLKGALKKGIIVKSDMALQKLSEAKNVFFDKTGTLTFGQIAVSKWEGESSPEIKKIILGLEENSHHVVALALKDDIGRSNIKKDERLLIEDIKEIPGLGVEGRIGEDFYELQAASFDKANKNFYYSKIVLLKNKKFVCSIILSDKIRPQAHEVISFLQKIKMNLFILSGDRSQSVKYLGEELSIQKKRIFSSLSPFEKKEMIQSFNNTVMIGDGANDALALQASDVGIVVSGGLYAGIQAADIYLTKAGVRPIGEIFIHAKKTIQLIKINTFFSLFYNILGVSFALLGKVNPLWAAIFMPIQALSVFSYTLFFARKNL
mgnify:CR=1 FL=1